MIPQLFSPALFPAVFITLIIFGFTGCRSSIDKMEESRITNEDEIQIKELHNTYVNGWKEMNEDKIMDLLEENAMIQPNTITPIKGKENIRNFWFPKDSSITIINTFNTEILSIHIEDSLAVATHKSHLDWDYTRDTLKFGRNQKGINTTVYRKQTDKSWKIWRSMWTDIYAQSK